MGSKGGDEMKVLKIILLVLLVCMLIPVILAVLLVGFIIFQANLKYGPPLHQPSNQIAKIELLDTHAHDMVLLYELEGSEFDSFVQKLESIKFQRYVNDPQTYYGIVAVKITYQNGWHDILGTHFNKYCTPEGINTASDGWYYCSDNEFFIALFCQYVDPATIPKEMS